MNDQDKQTSDPKPAPSGCSLFKVFQISFSTPSGGFCPFCFEICQKAELQTVSLSFENSGDTCSCTHNENTEFFQKAVKFNSQNVRELELRKFLAFNSVFATRRENKNFLEIIDPDVFFFIKTDFENLQKRKFRWEDIDLPAIDQRKTFLKNLNEAVPNLKLTILDTRAYESLFSLKFIDMITEPVNYNFGESIYNKSLEFYTNLLESFIKFYLIKDFYGLDKINAEDIQTYNPFSRYYVKESNQKNPFICEKYFSKEFNLVKFAIKLVNKFVPGATWRWIGLNHNCHVYSVKICKIIVEYGLVNEEDFEDIKMALYSKIPVFLALEKAIDRDNMSDDIKIPMLEGMINVREYYSEILIHYLYMKQDRAVLDMLREIHQNKKANQGNITTKVLGEIVKFDKSVLFEEEFGRKMMEFLLGYIVSQNTIRNRHLESKKIIEVISKFLYIISNVDDPYLLSLKLIREEDLINFSQVNFEGNPKKETIMTKKFVDFNRNLTNILVQTMNGNYLYREKLLLTDLNKTLDDINKEINFRDNYNSKTLRFYEIQRAISSTNTALLISNIMNLYVINDKKINQIPEFEDVYEKYSEFIQFYLNENLENQMTFLKEETFTEFEEALYNAPFMVSSLLYDIFSKNSLIMIAKDKTLDFFQRIFRKLNTEYFSHPEQDGFQSLFKILEIQRLYINFTHYKIFFWIPEYDVRISSVLIEEAFSDYFRPEIYEEILLKKEDLREVSENNKLRTMIKFLDLMGVSSICRFRDSVYKRMTESFTKEKLARLLDLVGENYEIRKVLLQIYCNFHIDLKNHLLDNRSEYYSTKPVDPVYNEDPFYDQEFDKTIALFINEIKFLIEKKDDQSQEKSRREYLNQSLFSGIIDLMNYFMMVREEDMPKLLKYVQKMEEFYHFMLANKENLQKIDDPSKERYDSGEKFTGEKDPFLSEIENIDVLFRFKRDRMKIQTYSSAIYEICSELMKTSKVSQPSKKTLARTNTINNIKFAMTQFNRLSPQMRERQNTLDSHLSQFNLLKSTFDRAKVYPGKYEIKVMEFMIAQYQNFKMAKMSVEAEKNFYIASLRDNSQEVRELCFNLCSFAFSLVKNDWIFDRKIQNFLVLECLCNTLFISTEAIQDNLLRIFKTKGDCQVMFENIWIELLSTLSFVIFKTNIDLYWKEAYRKLLILIKFYLFTCENNNKDFKDMQINEKAQPTDDAKFMRIDRWMNVIQRLCDNCQWHTNYPQKEISDFSKQNRAHLILIGISIFEVLTEFCTGPQENIQKRIYTYPYERYTGILNRFTEDHNSIFYKMKLSLVEFMLAMSEGMNEDIVDYHSTNFEIHNLNEIAINSIRQLFYCVVKKQKFNKGKLSDYPLKLSEFKSLMKEFENNPSFYHHPLMRIAIKLYCYFHQFAGFKSKYVIFLKEREYSLQIFEKNHYIPVKSIREDDLFVYKFMSTILLSVEIDRGKAQPVVLFYFPIEPKCFYLSEETKNEFVKSVDRSTPEAKLNGLLSNAKFFKYEMEYSQKYFKTRAIHEFLGSGLQMSIFEIVTFLLSCGMNIILLLFYDSHEMIDDPDFVDKEKALFGLGLTEIFLSFITICSFMYLNFPMVRKINRQKYQALYAYKKKLNLFDLLYIDVIDSFLRQKVVLFFYHILFVSLGLSVSFLFIGIDFFSIANLHPTMLNIINAFTKHLSQIITTLVLAGVLMYSYSTFVHIYFIHEFSSDFPGDIYCSSLSHCFFTIIDKAFRNGEGIGGILNTAFYGNTGNEGGDPRFYLALVLNLSFFMIINIVILNIILAILVDTFSQLRRKSDEFVEDTENICFICGQEKFQFEKAGIDFDKHRENEHNFWNYIYLIITMYDRDSKETNGIEHEIWDKITASNLDWIPHRRSWSLDQKQEKLAVVVLEDLQTENENLRILVNDMLRKYSLSKL